MNRIKAMRTDRGGIMSETVNYGTVTKEVIYNYGAWLSYLTGCKF